jgi:hypothetical protein
MARARYIPSVGLARASLFSVSGCFFWVGSGFGSKFMVHAQTMDCCGSKIMVRTRPLYRSVGTDQVFSGESVLGAFIFRRSSKTRLTFFPSVIYCYRNLRS